VGRTKRLVMSMTHTVTLRQDDTTSGSNTVVKRHYRTSKIVLAAFLTGHGGLGTRLVCT